MSYWYVQGCNSYSFVSQSHLLYQTSVVQWIWNKTTETSWPSSGFTCKTVFFAVIFHCLVDDLIHFSMYFPTLTLFISSFCFFLNELHKCCICVIYKNNVAIQTFFMQILKLNRKIWTSFWFHIIVDTKNLCNFQSFLFYILKYQTIYVLL